MTQNSGLTPGQFGRLGGTAVDSFKRTLDLPQVRASFRQHKPIPFMRQLYGGSFLKDKSDYSVELYNRFVETLEAIGPFIYAPVKTRIGFQVRTIFAAINRIGPDYIEGHLCLARHCKGSPFYKIECFSPRLHVHHFKIRKAGDIDRESQAILRETYIGGRGSIGRK